jgi:formamidopyrimidine-DNA glycosylase
MFPRRLNLPELPEVETMVRGIRPHVTGRPILDVERCPNSCKPISLTPSFRKFRERLVGQRFSAVRRLGKRVVFDLSDGSNLVVEPRMTGLMLLTDPPSVEHLRLRWQLEGAGQYNALWFWDRRGLGVVRLHEPGQLARQLGPQVLGLDALEMTRFDWAHCCGRTHREIKVLLLDQKVVAGIGNLYASEILHVAQICPRTAASRLTPSAISKLTRAVKDVLLHAIQCEGSTLGDGTYRNALNKNGSYQNQHRVYMKQGMPCPTCRKGEIVRIVQAQRSTFFCPQCQKLPGRHG